MELQDYTDADLWLTEALETNPEIMSELGGPIALEDIPATHRRRLDASATGGWWLKIQPEGASSPAGVIGLWEGEWGERPIHEVGWMVLPQHQGRGIAGRALDLLLARARAEPGMERAHAFPAVSNAPSNALCRRAGFVWIEECEAEYAGRSLRCNHWELEL